MDEKTFKQQLIDWRLNVRDAIIPTSGGIRLYSQSKKTKIIPGKHEYLIYACVKPFQCSDELYIKLKDTMHLNDDEVLAFLHAEYDQHLKDIRKQIIKLQRTWSKSFAQTRAKLVIQILEYDNVYHICDLAIERIVPIELILKSVFQVTSKYGDHRRVKEKNEIYMDPRVIKAYHELLRLRSTTIVHPRKN